MGVDGHGERWFRLHGRSRRDDFLDRNEEDARRKRVSVDEA